MARNVTMEDSGFLINRRYLPKSGAKFVIFLQIGPKIDICS